MALTSWDLPLRHRISGKPVYVIKHACSKNYVALGYSPHGPTEEIVMRNGIKSAHSQFLDLENYSGHSGGQAPSELKATGRRQYKEVHVENVNKIAAKQRERDSAAMADNPLWGTF